MDSRDADAPSGAPSGPDASLAPVEVFPTSAPLEPMSKYGRKVMLDARDELAPEPDPPDTIARTRIGRWILLPIWSMVLGLLRLAVRYGGSGRIGT